jgi:hypothetical protein
MSELTIVACPTCGLPAELVARLEPDQVEGGRPDLMIRCVDKHVSTIPLTPSAPELHVSIERVSSPPATAVVVAMRPRRRLAFTGSAVSSSGRLAQAAAVALHALVRRIRGLSQRSVRALWFAYGAAAAVLFVREPLAALVVLPLTIPIVGLARARRSWKAFADTSTLQHPEPNPEDAAGCQAA